MEFRRESVLPQNSPDPYNGRKHPRQSGLLPFNFIGLLYSSSIRDWRSSPRGGCWPPIVTRSMPAAQAPTQSLAVRIIYSPPAGAATDRCWRCAGRAESSRRCSRSRSRARRVLNRVESRGYHFHIVAKSEQAKPAVQSKRVNQAPKAVLEGPSPATTTETSERFLHTTCVARIKYSAPDQDCLGLA